MQFNFINLMGFIIVAVMLIPNIIYGIKFKGLENKCTNKAMNVIEQVGRYFFLSGVTLYHWALVVAAIIFGVGHIYVTYRNNIKGYIWDLSTLE